VGFHEILYAAEDEAGAELDVTPFQNSGRLNF
jgi:hypothetical protein